MNRKQIIVLFLALIVSVLIVWHALPIEFPGVVAKVLLLFVKLMVVLALAIFAYIFAGGRRSQHERMREDFRFAHASRLCKISKNAFPGLIQQKAGVLPGKEIAL